jgi:hypothetical protein
LINEQFDLEFKLYMRNKGINFDPNVFDLKFNPPQNFAAYRQAEMDGVRINTFGSIAAVPHISKRFALKRFLGLTSEEVAENEQMWKEENGLSKDALPAGSELRGAGVTADGMQTDLDTLSQSGEAPEGMEGGPEPDMSGASPAPADGSAPAPV